MATRLQQIEYAMIIAMVVGGFFLSYGIRTQSLDYGMAIDEFDPYFNYRATKYLHENGFDAYTKWHDELSWYPHGRDVYHTSQVMLHVTAATLYQPFADHMSLKDFVIYFPAIIGSATVVPIFLVMTKLTNRRIGGMSAVFYGCSIPFIQRGMAGWFKSEPLGLFYGIFAMYFMVAGVMSILSGQRKGIIQLVGAGVFIAVGISSWGGVLFFLIPMAGWLIIIPAFKHKLKQGIGIVANMDGTENVIENAGYHLKTLLIGLGSLIVTLYLVSLPFERSHTIIGNYVGLAFAFVIGFLIFEHFMNKKFSYKITVAVFFGVIIAFGAISFPSTSYGAAIRDCDGDCPLFPLPFDRYIKTLLPYDPNPTTLSTSVAEHQAPEWSHIFVRTVFLFIFTPLGFYAIFKRQVPIIPASFALVMSIIAMYVGSTYVRLELFTALGMILMASIGILYLFQRFEQSVTGKGGRTMSENQLRKRKMKGYMIVAFLLISMMYPAVLNWSIMVDRPSLIMFGGSMLGQYPTNDWLDALEWIRTNTPEDSKVMAWWDYGYWIQTMANRTTYMDNGAYMTNVIVENANIFTDEPYSAVERLQAQDVDYMLIYFTGEKIDDYARLGLGGDISKMYWILSIGERDPNQFFDSNRMLTDNFYENTLYGSMIPFVNRAEIIDSSMEFDKNQIAPWTGNPSVSQERINPATGQLWDYGWMKFQLKDAGGMRLVYASPGFTNVENGPFHAVLVYEVPK